MHRRWTNTEIPRRVAVPMGNGALVLLSGGLDSAVSAYYAKGKYSTITCLTFNYYKRLEREKQACKKLAAGLGCELIGFPIEGIAEAEDSELVSTSAPGSYIAARNIIFYGIAAHLAERRGIPIIIGGHVGSDAEKFGDASRRFFKNLNSCLSLSLITRKVTVVTPFIQNSKTEVVALGIRLGVPFEFTWSCQTDSGRPCGHCYSCAERQKAFEENSMVDPLQLLT